MSMCMKELDAGKRRFGSAVDEEIKMCFGRFLEAVHVVASIWLVICKIIWSE